MTYEEEPNIFSETDITPEEYTEDMIKQERLAFADWLKEIAHKAHYDNDFTWEVLLEVIEAKIKELRSNPLPKQSVDGKERSGGKDK